MKRISRQLLLGIAVVVVFALIWQKITIFIRINLSAWSGLAIFGMMVLGVFLALDHLFNRD